MGTILNPYLSFRDTARQAIEFYHSVFGGELTISTYGEFHASEDPAEADKVMHSMITTDGGLNLMAADTPNVMPYNPGENVSVSLSGDAEAELRGYWDKLIEGGKVTFPLDLAPWGDYFGQVVDKFGITWLVNISGQPQS